MILSRFDRYLLQRLLLLFGFFSLILVLVFWVNSAVSLLETLMGDGQSAATFAGLSLLGLPYIISSVLPITAFIAAVFGINQMSADSELVVVQATGFSPWRLARPVLAFGAIAALMMLIITHLLVPLSRHEVSMRQTEIAQDVTARLLTAGKFIHPTRGITFYVRETPPNGELIDIFLSDTRTDGRREMYMAKRALFAKEDSGPVLLMFDGSAQTYDTATQRLSVTTFDSFAYGLGDFLGSSKVRRRALRTIPTHELILSAQDVMQETNRRKTSITEEIHSRTSKALLAAVAPLIGFAALIAGGFSRFGLWRHIFIAFGLLIFIKVLDNIAASQLQKSPEAWGLLYIPHVVGIMIVVLWLWFATKPQIFNTFKRRKTATDDEASHHESEQGEMK
jgi:lipopolysaccharide export system permease protein